MKFIMNNRKVGDRYMEYQRKKVEKIKTQKRAYTPTVEAPPEIEDISNKTNQNKDISQWLEEDET